MTRTEQIYKNFADELLYFIKKRADNISDAEDILQDVFIKIHSSIDSLQNETKLRAWIFQIARNTIIDHYRKIKPADNNLPELVLNGENDDESPKKQLADSIREMIDDLPEKYSKVLCLKECYGYTQKEVSEKLELSYSGTKSRIQRGRDLLRDSLMKCCHYEFDKYGTPIDYHPITCCCCEQHSRK